MKSEIFLAVISWMNSCLGWMNRLHSNSKSSNLCIHPFSCLEKRWECANSCQYWGSTKGLFWAALAFWNTCLWTVNSSNERFINSLALHLSVSEMTSFISADVCSAELSAAVRLHWWGTMSWAGALIVLSVHLLLSLLCCVSCDIYCLDKSFLSQRKGKKRQVCLLCLAKSEASLIVTEYLFKELVQLSSFPS